MATFCGHFCLVALTGVEPVISWMRTRRPGPLDDSAEVKEQRKLNLSLRVNDERCREVTYRQTIQTTVLAKWFFNLSRNHTKPNPTCRDIAIAV